MSQLVSAWWSWIGASKVNKPSVTAGEIDMLPWNEMETLHQETSRIQEQLVALNRAGCLTINSQPAVNGALSTDPVVGWGGPRG